MKNREVKKNTRVVASGYSILVPVYYENEDLPAWRKVYTGTYKECEDLFSNYPDYYNATNEENHKNRQNKIQEYIFLCSIKKYVEAEKIKKQYSL